jgi:RimJ/RimL family protein N-acetyltransferase
VFIEASLAKPMNTADMDDADFVECACPHCGQELSFPVSDVGTPQLCIRCSELCIIPIDGAKVAGKLPFPVTTERLILRRFVPIDWKDLFEILSDEELWRHHEEDVPDDETVVNWLDRDAKNDFVKGERLAIALELAASPKVIGCLTMWYNGDKFDELGFDLMIHRDHRKQGYAVEALHAFFKLAFQNLHVHRVEAAFDSRATAFARALEHAGMRREGEFLQDRRVKGEWASTTYYGLLASEFHARP